MFDQPSDTYSGGSRISQKGDTNPKGSANQKDDSAKFSRKRHENEENEPWEATVQNFTM